MLFRSDGIIEFTDANTISLLSAITNLSIDNSGIYSLSGIEELKNLVYLDCGENNIHELNLSRLSKLETLSCYTNKLRSLNVLELENLGQLLCDDNQLTSLDVRGLSKLSLTSLSCGGQKNEEGEDQQLTLFIGGNATGTSFNSTNPYNTNVIVEGTN